jgi:glycosyltransferase involved in cell wall biosynthesis
MRKLKLAVFNTQPPHLYFGGVERRIIETTRRLRPEIDTTVYSGTKAGFKKSVLINGINFIPGFSTDMVFPLDNWFFNRTLSGAVNMIKADVYESHAISGYGFLMAIKERSIQKPFIHTVHGVLADEYATSIQRLAPTFRTKLANLIMWKLARLEKKTSKNATLIVTVSKYSSGKIAQLYDVDKGKIRVVPNGVDTEWFKPLKTCEKIKRQIGLDDNPCVLFVGRLIPRKGLQFLIEAAKHIVKDYSQAKFVIVGDGPLGNNIRVNLNKMNLKRNFIMLGDVHESLLPTLYNCADVFSFPSVQEGQGIALLEAQASAKPVVAFNVGGVCEAVLNEETGLLVKPNSLELADAILKLLADRALREKMGTRGRNFVSETFSWNICAQKMLKVYYEATDV